MKIVYMHIPSMIKSHMTQYLDASWPSWPGCLALEVNPDGSIRDVINHLSHLQKKKHLKKTTT